MRQERRLNSFHLRCLKRILKISWQDHVLNSEILQRANTHSMFSLLSKLTVSTGAELNWSSRIYLLLSSYAYEQGCTPVCAHYKGPPASSTYIRTETYTQPMNEYQVIREKAASQRRDVEKAFTRFIAKTGKTQSLFKDDAGAFPLIAVQPHPQPYLSALFPKDQDLDPQQDSSSSLADSDPKQSTSSLDNSQGPQLDLSQSLLDTSDPDAIDNPYLRPVKLPRFKRKY
ncbi:hypothetical protein ACJMK2_036129 [Sinanodonta woodiana]|uniref:Transcription initiation factor TFIID subunit 8 n=1 Tax=Sinanodonta woodiana TaxID=1069815 RepID=A0ABD3WG91_SINWO